MSSRIRRDENERLTVYDGIKITKRGIDIIIISLSFLLFIILMIAIFGA